MKNYRVLPEPWSAENKGWDLDLLALPAVGIDGLYIDGTRVDDQLWEADRKSGRVVWKGSQTPDPGLSVAVQINRKRSVLSSWRNAGVSAALLAIFTTLVTHYGESLIGSSVDPCQEHLETCKAGLDEKDKAIQEKDRALLSISIILQGGGDE